MLFAGVKSIRAEVSPPTKQSSHRTVFCGRRAPAAKLFTALKHSRRGRPSYKTKVHTALLCGRRALAANAVCRVKAFAPRSALPQSKITPHRFCGRRAPAAKLFAELSVRAEVGPPTKQKFTPHRICGRRALAANAVYRSLSVRPSHKSRRLTCLLEGAPSYSPGASARTNKAPTARQGLFRTTARQSGRREFVDGGLRVGLARVEAG